MEKVYLVFNGKNSIGFFLFKDLDGVNGVKVVPDVFAFRNRLLKRLFWGLKPLSKHAFWGSYQLKHIDFRDAIVVFDNESLANLSERRLKKIKNAAKGVCVFFIDEFSNDYYSIKNAKKLYRRQLFDYAFTYSPSDSATYGIPLNLSYYKKNPAVLPHSSVRFDLFFIGNVKKRKLILKSLLEYFQEKGIVTDFYVAGSLDTNAPYTAIRYLEYDKAVDKMLDSNCILDVSDPGTSGVSLRYFEAVVYNKKLLSNNPAIKDLPYFNPAYMKIFQDPADIDIGWLKKEEPIDYHYKGDFEPEHFMEEIKKRFATSLS